VHLGTERRGGALERLRPRSRGTVLHGRKKDVGGVVGMEEAGAAKV